MTGAPFKTAAEMWLTIGDERLCITQPSTRWL